MASYQYPKFLDTKHFRMINIRGKFMKMGKHFDFIKSKN